MIVVEPLKRLKLHPSAHRTPQRQDIPRPCGNVGWCRRTFAVDHHALPRSLGVRYMRPCRSPIRPSPPLQALPAPVTPQEHVLPHGLPPAGPRHQLQGLVRREVRPSVGMQGYEAELRPGRTGSRNPAVRYHHHPLGRTMPREPDSNLQSPILPHAKRFPLLRHLHPYNLIWRVDQMKKLRVHPLCFRHGHSQRPLAEW